MAIPSRTTAESFADLRTIAFERGPFLLPTSLIERALRRAEAEANFQVDVVSPAAAARSIRVPVLIVHGDNDMETPPEHARRIYAGLAGPRRLLLVPGAGHNGSLSASIWAEVDDWIKGALSSVPR